jgi:hypothetical protein
VTKVRTFLIAGGFESVKTNESIVLIVNEEKLEIPVHSLRSRLETFRSTIDHLAEKPVLGAFEMMHGGTKLKIMVI